MALNHMQSWNQGLKELLKMPEEDLWATAVTWTNQSQMHACNSYSNYPI